MKVSNLDSALRRISFSTVFVPAEEARGILVRAQVCNYPDFPFSFLMYIKYLWIRHLTRKPMNLSVNLS